MVLCFPFDNVVNNSLKYKKNKGKGMMFITRITIKEIQLLFSVLSLYGSGRSTHHYKSEIFTIVVLIFTKNNYDFVKKYPEIRHK